MLCVWLFCILYLFSSKDGCSVSGYSVCRISSKDGCSVSGCFVCCSSSSKDGCFASGHYAFCISSKGGYLVSVYSVYLIIRL